VLRHDSLHAVAARAFGAEPAAPRSGLPWAAPPPLPEPEVRAGPLHADDAVILASDDLLEFLSEGEVCRTLQQAYSPRVAALRLAELGRQRGAGDLSVAVLFTGTGPPAALRSFVGAPAAAGYDAPSPPELVRMGGFSAGEGRVTTGVIVALAGLTGALLGIAAGLFLAFSLLRPALGPVSRGAEPETVRAEPQPAPPLSAASLPGLTPVPPVVSSPFPPAPKPPAPPAAAPAEPPYGPAVPNRSLPAEPGARAASFPEPGGRAEPLPGRPEPPPHSLGNGLPSQVRLRVAAEPVRGLLILMADRGTLYTMQTPTGVPSGTPLAAIMPTPSREQLEDNRSELRFLTVAGFAAASVHGEELKRLMQGGTVHVEGLTAGDYRLAWWHPESRPPAQPFLALRVAGP
jgi:hypothetical protein